MPSCCWIFTSLFVALFVGSINVSGWAFKKPTTSTTGTAKGRPHHHDASSIVTQRRRRVMIRGAATVPSLQQLGTFESLSIPETQIEHKRLVLVEDYTDTTISFDDAWTLQRSYWQEHADRLSLHHQQQSLSPNNHPYGSSFLVQSSWQKDEDENQSPPHTPQGVDRILFLQHDPVYTLGTGSDPRFILSSNNSSSSTTTNSNNIPIVRMDRGGEVTYHGPGQLVVYPILDLRNYRQDIHWYMRALEEAVIVALHALGLTGAGRDDDTTGVWMHQEYKVAAMGVKCRKWITMHGLAVNVEPQSLIGFEGIVPCGLHGRKVGCVSQFAGRHVTVQEFAPHLKAAMEQVFFIRLVER